MKTAIYGGSFNPVHFGHINLVKEVLKAVSLNRIIIMPANISPFKQKSADMADGIHRIAMCRLAFSDFPEVIISDFELITEGVSYTINTLRYFKEIYPEDELFFIMGSDAFFSLQNWFCFEEIMSLCTIIAASRIQLQKDFEILQNHAEFIRKYGNVNLISISAFEASSTEIREKIMNNDDITCYVPQNVVKYISEMHLYGSI